MKTRTKRFLGVLLIAAWALTAWAQSNDQKLVVWMKGGEKVYYNLAEEPRTTFNGSLLNITTNTVSASYQRTNILRYTFEGNSTAIAAPQQKGLVFAQDNDGLTLSNLPGGTPVALYDMAGRLLQSYTAEAGKTLEISLTNRPTGVYVVQMKGHSLKITKR